jgi:hypothetical protein
VKHSALRLGALASVATLAVLSAAPAQAATVAQSTATAYTISIGGSGTDSGTVEATHDGTEESVTGESNPPVDVLDNQRLVNVGVLAQDATAEVQGDGDGWSAACAGVAGEGGSVAQVGDSACLTPGEPIGLSIANLDLTGVQITDEDSALAPLGDALQPLADQLVGPLTAAVSDGLAPLGEIGLAGTFGALEARCVADPDGASGGANIANSQLALTLAGETVDVVDLPANPEPNTEIPVDLDAAATAVLAAVEEDLNDTFEGQLSDLTGLTDAVQEQVVDNILAQIAPQLQPLQDNVLRVVLNEQSRDGGSIEVTALHAEVLPAAQQLGAESLLETRLGTVTCGPNDVLAPASSGGEGPGAADEPEQDLPDVPTAVASGVDGGGPTGGTVALTALAALGGALGLVGLRRSVTR